MQDNSFAGKKTALTSIPYSKIQSVSYVSDKSMFGKFASTSTTYEVQFRGAEKAAHAHNIVLWNIMR